MRTTSTRSSKLSLLAGIMLGASAMGLIAAAPTKEEPPAAKSDGETKRTGGKAADLYAKGKKQCDDKKYVEALLTFEQAIKIEPADADVLNMLAFSQRKNGKLLEARENYRKALGIRPEFPEAREYLGENYLMLAREQLDVLRGYGAKGSKEAAELEAAFNTFAAAASKR